jgi:DNA repair photolyase
MNQHETEIEAETCRVRVHSCNMKTGISRTHEFEKKGLATHAINIGTKCGHGCLYCSTGPMLRMHKSFQMCGEDPFGIGYAIIDPMTHERVSRDAKRIKKRGMVQLCTVTDVYAPEAQEANLGSKCLQAILSEPGWNVRVLTKNAAVKQDFSYIKQHSKRVLVGISITGPPDRSDVIEIVEPNASGNR